MCQRLEAGDSLASAHASTLEALQKALERAGIEFIDENGGGVGVRLRRRRLSTRTAREIDTDRKRMKSKYGTFALHAYNDGKFAPSIFQEGKDPYAEMTLRELLEDAMVALQLKGLLTGPYCAE